MIEASLSPASPADPNSAIPVSILNRRVRECIESSFPLLWVSGELSNVTHAASGHVYFSLKDAEAQVRCVMFRSRVQLLGWRPANGQRVEARVLVSLYEARGDFQLNVETMRQSGLGSLYEQFLRRKAKLEAEGLFATDAKRPLPAFPTVIGVVTSLQAAALRDVLTTLSRRAPHVKVIAYPTPVQGEGAGEQIAAALGEADRHDVCDVIILCRGGGSLEDLWAFNDEGLARAIRASRRPVIAGVGHETDFTIADFAADRRAATPTAAAEMAAPERAALIARIDALHNALTRQLRRDLERRAQRLDLMAGRLQHPAQRLANQREALDNLKRRLASALRNRANRSRQALGDLTQRLLLARPRTADAARRLDALPPRLHGNWAKLRAERAAALARLGASLDHLNPHAVLARGYGIVSDANGKIVRDSRQLEPNERITVCLHSGRLDARIETLSHATEPEDH
ncbi:exodeoxyribonuclease VII large subunit [Propionivibrio dicarboxylicus]|uniref:Exodeoxyribonuclease 7 large subunit n=1 Tax=Propionivibrio dicarboxylicus TaxID=83767 RepID=A0A1G8BH19_9RHOO|nr:exodeoxyribonuclease VII large subunit [Propionivibrio dicarboxylicus]SDH32509.1 Exodeoxyribonuclease VII large subunit [Propionivibrio dicarboxylicus]